MRRVFVECPECKHGQGQNLDDAIWLCSDCGRAWPHDLRKAVVESWEGREVSDDDDGAGEMSLLR